MYLNKVIIAGNLTKDIEVKTTQQGTAVCSFTVAVNRKTKQSDGTYRDEVDFIDCNAWDKKAEFLHRYFRKGDGVCVLGTIRNRKWTDKDGKARTATEVLAEDILFNGEKKATEPAEATENAEHKQAEQGGRASGRAYKPVCWAFNAPPSDYEPAEFEPLDNDQDLPF